jgi:hypothetical protein
VKHYAALLTAVLCALLLSGSIMYSAMAQRYYYVDGDVFDKMTGTVYYMESSGTVAVYRFVGSR